MSRSRIWQIPFTWSLTSSLILLTDSPAHQSAVASVNSGKGTQHFIYAADDRKDEESSIVEWKSSVAK